jgi:type VI secretion system protein ImpH
MQQVNPIKQLLLDEAYRFSFFKAVHLLEHFTGKSPGKGLSPVADPVQFSVRPGFGFPASDIQHVEQHDDSRPPCMQVNFMGLIGPKGVLPDWYNTHAQNLNYRKDYGLTDFLDIFHHRLISLFYLAWKKYRLSENYQAGGTDPISQTIASLAGISEREQVVDPDFFGFARKRLVHFCGLVARNVPTTAAIESIVGHTVGAPVRVEQFVERLIPIHAHDRTRLGSQNSALSKDALCGRHIRDVSAFFRVHIGPMSWKRYLVFAPHSRNLFRVKQLIAYLAGIEYEFVVRLIIHGREFPALGLGSTKQPPILGRTMLMRLPERLHCKDVVVRANGGFTNQQTYSSKGTYDKP